MLTLAAAVCLIAALVIDVSRAGSPTLAAIVLAVAGMAFVLLASVVPPRHRPDRRSPVSEPHFGRTRHGLPVHMHTFDHHKSGKFNKTIARVLTARVGTMGTFWIFNVLALLSLPATFHLMGVIPLVYHATGLLKVWNFCLSYGWIFLITWVCQNYIQLVLLPALMTGQNLQNEAADARAAKTFEDVEAVRNDLTVALDRLDEKTEGGIKAVLDAVNALAAQKAPPVKRLATRAERGSKEPGA